MFVYQKTMGICTYVCMTVPLHVFLHLFVLMCVCFFRNINVAICLWMCLVFKILLLCFVAFGQECQDRKKAGIP